MNRSIVHQEDIMEKADLYRQKLGHLSNWDAYLMQESRLPGPRANLELASVVAEAGDPALFSRYLTLDAQAAPANTPEEFLAFCGVLGLGRMCAQGDPEALERLRSCASDARWRIREAVAMALQRLGAADMDALLAEMVHWSEGNLLEQRAAAAALCHPDLLQDREQAELVLQILDSITASLQSVEDRRSDEFKALRKGLGYCWSVAVCAHPAKGKTMMERWFASDDRDIRWIMVQNLRKKRLERMDAEWVADWKAQLAGR
jgi:3-methyladenine DNA glycosylase AlkC